MAAARTANTADELRDYLEAQMKREGNYFVIKRIHRDRTNGKYDPNGPPIRYDLVCDRGKRREKVGAGLRKTESRKCNCPWTARIVLKKKLSRWELYINDRHIHEPAPLADSHPTYRRHQREAHPVIGERVQSMTTDGNKTAKEIVQALRKDNELVSAGIADAVTVRDVRNAQYNLRKERYGELSPTQMFLESLVKANQAGEIEYELGYTGDNKVDRSMWAYKECIQVWKDHPDVLIMDCTYKTNHLNLPLLQITGVTCVGTNLSVAFALISAEDEQGFSWPLQILKSWARKYEIPEPRVVVSDFDKAYKNAAATILPAVQQQLCRWHIMRNVEKHFASKWLPSPPPYIPPTHHIIPSAEPPPALRTFPYSPQGLAQAWTECVNTRSEAECRDTLATIMREFSNQHTILAYIRTTCVPVMSQFAMYAIIRYRNFGVKTTSRTEGEHARLKSWQGNTAVNLDVLFTRVHEMT